MTAKLIPLRQWAKDTYGDASPSIGTLRRWARDNRLAPRAEKHGRAYFVSPDTRYVANNDEMSGGIHPMGQLAVADTGERASGLIETMLRDRKKKSDKRGAQVRKRNKG